jgi:transcriptional regulator with XRE-family HTH domain
MKTGDRIREFRKRKRLTQEDFAEALGYSQGYLTEIETGKKEPSREVLKKIHEKFGVSTDYFLYGLSSTSWAEIQKELLEKGLEQEFIDRIHARFLSAVIASADEANFNLARSFNLQGMSREAQEKKKSADKDIEVFQTEMAQRVPLPAVDEEIEGLKVTSLLTRAMEILESSSIYRQALAANINAFHWAIRSEEKSHSLQGRIDYLEGQNKGLESRLAAVEEKLKGG